MTGAKFPVVHLQHFIQSMRDAGYRGSASAIAELVDNALEAEARSIQIFTSESGRLDDPQGHVAILDDGLGMNPEDLRRSLQFGGSTRFGSREGLGRFGVGLPASSWSRARQVDVYSWTSPGYALKCSLDFGEVIGGAIEEVPRPQRIELPEEFRGYCGSHGTLVVWSQCDRMDMVRPSTLINHLKIHLGRTFRHFLFGRHRLEINNEPVRPIDPLLLNENAAFHGATEYGTSLFFDVRVPGTKRVSQVEVRFSELPIEKWAALSIEEKRSMGVVKGAGVSVVRAGREIDYGWHFMDGKRRENYDDWWRCEVRFQPSLDELFGVTYTKQGIHPTDALTSILSPELGRIARKLNARVRRRFLELRSESTASPSETAASRYEKFLPSLPDPSGCSSDRMRLRKLGLKSLKKPYSVLTRPLKDSAFFAPLCVDGKVAVVINSDHPFYRVMYKPLSETTGQGAEVKKGLELLLLAAARAEKSATGRAADERSQLRKDWGAALAAFLGGS